MFHTLKWHKDNFRATVLSEVIGEKVVKTSEYHLIHKKLNLNQN